MCNCLCSVIVLCEMMMKRREKVKPGAGLQPALLEKHEGAARLNVPIRRTNRYQQYYMPSQHRLHIAEGFGILSRTVMYNLEIRKCTSPPLLAPRLKIFKLKFTTPPGIEPRTC